EADGGWYIVYGGWRRCNIAQLDESFTKLVPFPDGETFKDITPDGYVEGPTMFERSGLWYFLWSEGSWGNDTYHVVYATGPSPLGPWQRQGTILQSDETLATGAGHNSVMRAPGTDDWYIVYHRRPIPNQGRDHRVTCVDEMRFDSNGRILPVQMTWAGPTAKPITPAPRDRQR
ncbi:MAG: family 43 glycosylhydrolase, partial [Planctomycetota bacterium]